MKPSNIKEWERAKVALYAVYNRVYLADTWPDRLGFAELIALQSDGDLNAWKTCILHAVYNGDIPVQDEHWFLGAIEPSEFWAGHKPKMALIPSCQKHQGDNVAFFSGELVAKYTVSPKDFAEYLNKNGEKPSKYIAAWFDAFGVDMATAGPVEPIEPAKPERSDIPNNQDGKTYDQQKESFQKWINDSQIDIGVLKVEEILRQIKLGCEPKDKPLWNIKVSTFRRNFWQKYSKEYSTKKKRGRQARKIKI
ncbi:hypothetical protein [Methylobacter sp.]|uniref:hypothetical protein n=1 Tax=Methylobacter sp. TaxID=2051955 RepID=UPI003DA42EC1